ncbi:MAG: acyltransferase [Paludibacteraceae bacterium]|nr:acyltransferase [Paludibacteraceae bacterium]
MKTSFYTPEELAQLGLKSYGENVRISRYAQIYSPEKISIGENVRIDDFCILSGNIAIGSHIHIAAYCALYGADYGIVMEDYTGLSARATIYAAMDDFSGDYLIGPIHDDKYTNVTGGPVQICKYAQIGAGGLVFPNVCICDGAVLGAMSMAKQSLEPWSVYAGVPAKMIKNRSKGLLDLM